MSIRSTTPADGEYNVYYRTNIEVEFTGSDPDASISVTSSSGSPVSGFSTVSGDTVSFTPDSALTPETEYDVTAYSCAGPITFTFETSSVGLPLDWMLF